MGSATRSQPQHIFEMTILSRLASIPIIAFFLSQIHSTLSSNVLTRFPYYTAQVMTQIAYSFSQLLQAPFASFIVSVDGFANKGLDAIQEKYPFPFQIKPEEVVSYVRERRDSVVSSAVGFVEGVDRKFTPIVDHFENVVNKIVYVLGTSSRTSTSSERQHQCQRVYTISKRLGSSIYVYLLQRFKLLERLYNLVRKTIEAANHIQGLALLPFIGVGTGIHALSGNMLAGLQKLQLPTTILPDVLRFPHPDVFKTITNLRDIVATPISIGDKVHRLAEEMRVGVQPLLGKFPQGIGNLAEAIGSKGSEVRALLPHALQPTLPDISKTITGLRDIVTHPGMSVGDKVHGVAKGLTEPLLGKLLPGIGGLAEAISSKGDEVRATLSHSLPSIHPDISKTVTDLRGIVTTPILSVGDKVHGVAEGLTGGVLGKLPHGIGNLTEAIGGKKEEAGTGLPHSSQSVLPDISKTVTGLHDIVTAPILSVGDKVHGVAEGLTGGILGKVPHVVGNPAEINGGKEEAAGAGLPHNSQSILPDTSKTVTGLHDIVATPILSVGDKVHGVTEGLTGGVLGKLPHVIGNPAETNGSKEEAAGAGLPHTPQSIIPGVSKAVTGLHDTIATPILSVGDKVHGIAEGLTGGVLGKLPHVIGNPVETIGSKEEVAGAGLPHTPQPQSIIPDISKTVTGLHDIVTAPLAIRPWHH